MSTQLMFERQIEDVLGIDPEADHLAPIVAASSANRSGVELSLHEDLASIERDWRAFEERADLTAFQTFGRVHCCALVGSCR